MSQTRLFVAVAVAAALISTLTTGCTVIGYTLGAVADATSPDEDTLLVWQVTRLSNGDSISLTSGSDTKLKGVYLGMDTTRTKHYAERYNESLMTLSLPSLDDSIVIDRSSPLQPDVTGRLVGFDPGVICVQDGDNIETISVESVREVTGSSWQVVDRKHLQGWLQGGHVPFMSTLLISVEADSHRVPLYDLKEISVAKSKNAKRTGLASGVLLDVFVVAGVIWAISNFPILGQ